MSYEWYCEKGWIPNTKKPDIIRAGEMELIAVRNTIDYFCVRDSVGKKIKTSFSAYYIMKWGDCRLAARCGPTCANGWSTSNENKGFCKFRRGLLGRTLPRDELNVQFLTNYKNGQIKFVED